MTAIARDLTAATAELRGVLDFYEVNERERRAGVIDADLTFGNPNEMPLDGLVSAIKAAAEPRRADWFAYKASDAEARQAIAERLRDELRLPFEADDIAMTRGAFGAIAVAFAMLLEPGSEAVVPTPGWFLYAPVLLARGSRSVAAPLDPVSFDLDLAAIERAITPRTRVVVVNSPANPTGRIYTRERLAELADVLDRASTRIGRRITVLSDEPYRRIRFDGAAFTSPAAVYPWTLVAYSYGKVLLAPGQRIGYLALSPLMPGEDRTALREALLPAQIALGWAFPDAVMQYAVPALERLSLDVAALARKRDRLLGALGASGYRLVRPEGAFYIWGEAPGGDALRFCAELKRRGVAVLPGTLFGAPRHFRISLTASDAMVERALPGFRAAALAMDDAPRDRRRSA